MSDLRDHIGCLYHLSESVAKLDMLVSLANCSSINDWIRPEFTETTAIKSGIHPILQKVNSDVVISNDVYLSEGCNMIIISGPNMSGKSTYLKQMALIQIIAQLGSFVPAQYASFKIIDQIFARMGIQDNIECNASSFKVEMIEMSGILQRITDRSLILIDELAKGTSLQEGPTLCWAIAERLLEYPAFTLIVTHFRLLIHLESLYFGVTNCYMEAIEEGFENNEGSHLKYTYRLVPGANSIKHYGIKLAERMACFAESFLNRAKSISDSLPPEQELTYTSLTNEERARYHLAYRLEHVRSCENLSEDDMAEHLSSILSAYYIESGTSEINIYKMYCIFRQIITYAFSTENDFAY